MDTLIEQCPSWGYLLLLLVAFAASVVVAGFGLRAVGSVAQRVRRPNPLR
jgi:hypothetical protein